MYQLGSVWRSRLNHLHTFPDIFEKSLKNFLGREDSIRAFSNFLKTENKVDHNTSFEYSGKKWGFRYTVLDPIKRDSISHVKDRS